MQTFKIQAKYAKEVLIPLAAIENNVKFIFYADTEKRVSTLDGKTATVKHRRTVNILSEEGQSLLEHLCPNISPWNFIQLFYRRTDGLMASLEFQHLELSDPIEE